MKLRVKRLAEHLTELYSSRVGENITLLVNDNPLNGYAVEVLKLETKYQTVFYHRAKIFDVISWQHKVSVRTAVKHINSVLDKRSA